MWQKEPLSNQKAMDQHTHILCRDHYRVIDGVDYPILVLVRESEQVSLLGRDVDWEKNLVDVVHDRTYGIHLVVIFENFPWLVEELFVLDLIEKVDWLGVQDL